MKKTKKILTFYKNVAKNFSTALFMDVKLTFTKKRAKIVFLSWPERGPHSKKSALKRARLPKTALKRAVGCWTAKIALKRANQLLGPLLGNGKFFDRVFGYSKFLFPKKGQRFFEIFLKIFKQF